MGLVWELHTPSDGLLHLPVLHMMMLLKFGKAWQTLVFVMAWTLHVISLTITKLHCVSQKYQPNNWNPVDGQIYLLSHFQQTKWVLYMYPNGFTPQKWVLHWSKQFYPKGWVNPPSQGDVLDCNTGYNSIEIKQQRVIWVFFEGVRDPGGGGGGKNSSHAHNIRYWDILGVLFKISDKHPHRLYMGVQFPAGRKLFSQVGKTFSTELPYKKNYPLYCQFRWTNSSSQSINLLSSWLLKKPNSANHFFRI